MPDSPNEESLEQLMDRISDEFPSTEPVFDELLRSCRDTALSLRDDWRRLS